MMKKIIILLIFLISISFKNQLISQEILIDSILINNFKNKYKKCDTIYIKITNKSSYIFSLSHMVLQKRYHKEWIDVGNNILCIGCDWKTFIPNIEIHPDSSKEFTFDTSKFWGGCPKKGKKYRINIPFYLFSKDKKIINNRVEFNYEKKYDEFIYFTVE